MKFTIQVQEPGKPLVIVAQVEGTADQCVACLTKMLTAAGLPQWKLKEIVAGTAPAGAATLMGP